MIGRAHGKEAVRDLAFLCGDGGVRAELKEKVQMKELKLRGHCRVATLPDLSRGKGSEQ